MPKPIAAVVVRARVPAQGKVRSGWPGFLGRIAPMVNGGHLNLSSGDFPNVLKLALGFDLRGTVVFTKPLHRITFRNDSHETTEDCQGRPRAPMTTLTRYVDRLA